MKESSLRRLLEDGLSVEAIARRFAKHPSTVSYRMRRYGLVSSHRQKHAPKGGLDREALAARVDQGRSIREIAKELRRSPGAVRHWLARYRLETRRAAQLRSGRAARDAGGLKLRRECRHHGTTDFLLEGRGTYRCMRCRWEAVMRRRRRVTLVAERGGACAMCGHSRYLGALHFHHLDPGEKRFALAGEGAARSLARAREEAQKYVLLCSNCHAEVEAGIVQLPP